VGGCYLRRLRRVFFRGEDDVHPLLDQLVRYGRQGGEVSLGEANANDELFVLTVA
jgi:hypothetical protein